MSALDFGEGRGSKAREYGFNVSLIVLEGGCKRNNVNPNVYALSSNGGFSGLLNKMIKNEPDKYGKRSKLIGGNSPHLSAYIKGQETFGEYSNVRGRFVTYEYLEDYNSKYSWLDLKISAKGSYEILFNYRVKGINSN